MALTALLHLSRKPSLSPQQFRTHWETKHAPLIAKLAGTEATPVHAERYYMHLPGAEERKVVRGDPATDFDYDGFSIVTFRDEAHFRQFFAALGHPDNKALIEEDEERFIDRSKTKAVVIHMAEAGEEKAAQ